ncbi:extracellular solute-binding protein [Bacillus aquiflavi]|uniref:Extracellular solute-binding protein n=1 Tax=Bacillus aquiflavi TaxID=2672567 RepID=A0A6B3VY66_9BACI|nr:extracellular solute-binding protein [Bacillus aquiflavi]MBA4538699.1 extracellular solute-binding protein [Bacillus aquiflavi]NEY83059.1 extracellular solute-binding protein [Bacillus aquiflavi]UAC47376.1 extracellular solute-binding protein [Bacillus aquiflavi]
MKLTKKLLLGLLLALSFVLLVACGSSNKEDAQKEEVKDNPKKSGELVVYSSRKEKFVQPLLDKFEQETGIKVKALHADDTVINRIKEEGKRPQADILISNDIGAMEHLRIEGLLQGFDPKGIDSIDEKYRAEDNSWFGLSARTRILMYNEDLITEEEMPKTMWELTDPKWKGQFAITRGGNAGLVAQVSALRNEWGDEKTSEWLKKIKENAGAIMKDHGEIRLAVGSGEYKFGLVNNYYYHQQLNEPTNNHVGAVYTDQADDEMGVFVNAAGVAFIKGAPNEKNAKEFLEWILLEENQKEFSFASKEVPLNPNVQTTEEAKRISDYKTMEMPLSQLGKVWTDTKTLIEKAGLDLEVK